MGEFKSLAEILINDVLPLLDLTSEEIRLIITETLDEDFADSKDDDV